MRSLTTFLKYIAYHAVSIQTGNDSKFIKTFGYKQGGLIAKLRKDETIDL